jgi:hypothetical protein
MYISNTDLTLLSFLESIEANSEVPDGCDVEAIVSQGLATCEGTRCILTQAGRDRLPYLRTALQGDNRLGW